MLEKNIKCKSSVFSNASLTAQIIESSRQDLSSKHEIIKKDVARQSSIFFNFRSFFTTKTLVALGVSASTGLVVYFARKTISKFIKDLFEHVFGKAKSDSLFTFTYPSPEFLLEAINEAFQYFL